MLLCVLLQLYETTHYKYSLKYSIGYIMEMVRIFYDNGERIDVAFISAGVANFYIWFCGSSLPYQNCYYMVPHRRSSSLPWGPTFNNLLTCIRAVTTIFILGGQGRNHDFNFEEGLRSHYRRRSHHGWSGGAEKILRFSNV